MLWGGSFHLSELFYSEIFKYSLGLRETQVHSLLSLRHSRDPNWVSHLSQECPNHWDIGYAHAPQLLWGEKCLADDRTPRGLSPIGKIGSGAPSWRIPFQGHQGFDFYYGS